MLLPCRPLEYTSFCLSVFPSRISFPGSADRPVYRSIMEMRMFDIKPLGYEAFYQK